ncbi:unnamed protein product [Thelazia callipaeda]|uniref:Scm-like with four MBT domains protein 2 n=1 Tax=Thelazia callipaeda TaxID=103827 RepID=A0A0N5CQJ9_THECL|nr:unnamed protein product [Thelazia callipaeda]
MEYKSAGLTMLSASERYRPVVPVVSREVVLNSYSWEAYIEKILKNLNEKNDIAAHCPAYFVPVHYFYQAPFAEYMQYIDRSVKVEVTLYGDYNHNSDFLKLYWFARVMRVRMYGKECEQSDFWVNIGSKDIKPVGYCAENPESLALVPPEAIHDQVEDWSEFILHQIHAYRTLALNWPEVQVRKLHLSKFKKGDHMELLDSLLSNRVRPAYVKDVIGSRICVIANGMYLKHSETAEGSDFQLTEGVWMDQDSPLIFPVGWALKVGYNLMADEEYFKHAKEVAHAWKLDSNNIPYAEWDAHLSLFKIYSIEEVKKEIFWKPGMKVATVLDILDDGFLKIGFDGDDIEDTVPLHYTSDLLFPVGYAEKYGILLKGPKNIEIFDWKNYLEQCQQIAAPEELFLSFNEEAVSNFAIGSKLEATDMCEPHLICPATIASHHGRLLRVKYDGWDESYDQLFDYRSANIFPIGWCEMHCYKLEAPESSNMTPEYGSDDDGDQISST